MNFQRLTNFVLALFSILLINLLGCSSPNNDDMDYKLIWQDEFNGPDGQLPDASKWTFDIGTNWGNNQLEYDTDRAENVSLDGNGNLAIIAREEVYENRNYTSGRILTRDLFEPTYGRIEARMKLPIGQGIWPAFWMLGANFNDVGWPQCGEIDIMEYRGQEPATVHGSLHGPDYSGGDALTQSFSLSSGNFNQDFHLFAVEWRKDAIDWYVDGTHILSVKASHIGDKEWVFNHSFYIILNLAVGGNYVGPPNAGTAFPQTMLIDYVRVYEAK